MFPSPPGSDVYLDTAFVVNAVIGQIEDSAACIEATDQLIQGRRTVYFSEILRMEYAQALRRLATRHRLPPAFVQRFELDRWAVVEVRH